MATGNPPTVSGADSFESEACLFAAMTTVELEYCVPCDFRRRALDVETAVLGALEDEIDEFRLVMGDDGVFRVRVDGETVYDKQEEAFDVDGIVRAVRAAL